MTDSAAADIEASGLEEELARELLRARHPRKSLSPKALAESTSLLSLPCVAAPLKEVAQENAFAVVRRAIRRLSFIDRRQAVVWLGLTSQSAEESMGGRYKLLGPMINVTSDSWRTEHEWALSRRLAYEVVALNSRHMLLQQRRREIQVGHPTESRLNIDWYARMMHYSRCETAAVALSNDIDKALQLRGIGSEAKYEDFVRTSLYWFTVQAVLDEVRTSDFGGSWILTDPVSEERAADAHFQLSSRLLPFSQREVSRLRIRMRRDRDWEIDPFVLAVELDLPELIVKWHSWLDQCKCADLDLHHSECPIQELTEQVHIFSMAIRNNANDLTDWYAAQAISPTDLRSGPWVESFLEPAQVSSSPPPDLSARRVSALLDSSRSEASR